MRVQDKSLSRRIFVNGGRNPIDDAVRDRNVKGRPMREKKIYSIRLASHVYTTNFLRVFVAGRTGGQRPNL